MTFIDQPMGKNAQGSPALLLTKLHPPTARSQWVARERLFEQLRHEPGTKLTLVVAPAGSGKTTLLGNWLELEAARRSACWVSLDEGDNDPVVLWSHALESLRQACPALEISRTPERVGAARIEDAFLPDLANGLTEQGHVTLVLDDFHRVLSGPSRESVAWLVERAPPSFQLVIATRTEPALPLAALRAHGELVELRADDLGFTVEEADAFLNDRLALGLGRDEVAELVERTEGWPAGLYLAALSVGGAQDRHAFVRRFGGSSRHVVDFLVDEVLEAHDSGLQTLMIRSSIVERFCGPLCDALLERDGSAEQLAELARTNLFLLPLDDRGQWYRFHHLFGRLLRVELEHREPGLAQALHRRAYEWHRDHGSTDEAIEHALLAGAFAEAGELISSRWTYYLNACRQATVVAWLDRLPTREVESNGPLLAAKAWILSIAAKRDESLEAIAAAERLGDLGRGPLPDGASSVAASLATLRASFQWGDVGSGYENSVRAAELEEPQSPFWATVLWSRGMGHFYRGEFEEAEPWFADAAATAPSGEMWLVAGSALAYLSFIAGERGDIEEQRRLAEQAAQLARERQIEEIDGEVPAAMGASLAMRGEFEQARPFSEQGVVVLRAYGQPIDLAYALIRLIPVLRALGDDEATAAALAEARATVDSCPDPGKLEEWLAELEKPRRERAGAGDGELSERERTILRALTGPLSERDIARELYLSHNTVHSHTRSIYRKLGVSSRAEATQRARELGLL